MATVVTIIASFFTEKPQLEQLVGTCVTVSKEQHGQLEMQSASPFLEINPVHKQALRITGVMLLVVMLVLCVGFGYTDDPSEGGQITISGGVLSMICTCILATVVMIVVGASAYFAQAEHVHVKDGLLGSVVPVTKETSILQKSNEKMEMAVEAGACKSQHFAVSGPAVSQRGEVVGEAGLKPEAISIGASVQSDDVGTQTSVPALNESPQRKWPCFPCNHPWSF